MNWWERWQARRALRRLQRQRQDINTRVLSLMARLDELRGYVNRDRAAERRERDRLIRQIDAARERQVELEDLLRAYLHGQALIDAEAAAAKAREALTSGFGELRG